MQSRTQVRHKLKQVAYRHLQRKLRDNFRRVPATCKHNKAVPLGHDEVHLCGYVVDGAPRNVVCDSRVFGCDATARSCPFWSPILSREEIKAGFEALLESDRGTIATQYPDIAALMWVTSDEQETTPLDDDPEQPAPDPPGEAPADLEAQSLPTEVLAYSAPSLWERFLLWWRSG
jgi:hypothetical protein